MIRDLGSTLDSQRPRPVECDLSPGGRAGVEELQKEARGFPPQAAWMRACSRGRHLPGTNPPRLFIHLFLHQTFTEGPRWAPHGLRLEITT